MRFSSFAKDISRRKFSSFEVRVRENLSVMFCQLNFYCKILLISNLVKLSDHKNIDLEIRFQNEMRKLTKYNFFLFLIGRIFKILFYTRETIKAFLEI